MIEKWAQIEGYEGFYEVSDRGNVRSMDRVVPRLKQGVLQQLRRKSAPVRQNLNHKGYPEVTISKGAVRQCFRVHRLVAAAFVKGHTREQVNHINSIRNDNRAENLEWCSCKENIAHAIANDPNDWGRKPVVAFLSGEVLHCFPSIRAAERAGFSASGVSSAIKGRLRTHAGMQWAYETDYFSDLV